MKGIILAGGLGTRLYPTTIAVSKQLIPIYNKPMIFYPLSILMLAKIKEVLIISKPGDDKLFKKLFGNGKDLGMKIFYKIQKKPKGIADALIIGKKFIGKHNVTLILGDNILYSDNLRNELLISREKCEKTKKAIIFSYSVKNPNSYGVIKKKKNNIIKIVEKPKNYISNEAVLGLYMYPNSVVKKLKFLKPSRRNELEITDLNNKFIKEKNISVTKLGRGTSWFDAGTFDNLFEASQLIKIIENRIGLKIASLDEIAKKNKWI